MFKYLTTTSNSTTFKSILVLLVYVTIILVNSQYVNGFSIICLKYGSNCERKADHCWDHHLLGSYTVLDY